jgi:hypothetical protein
MRVVIATVLSLALAAGVLACGGTSKQAPTGPGASTMEGGSTGGSTYGGAGAKSRAPDEDPCGAKADPCGGDE